MPAITVMEGVVTIDGAATVEVIASVDAAGSIEITATRKTADAAESMAAVEAACAKAAATKAASGKAMTEAANTMATMSPAKASSLGLGKRTSHCQQEGGANGNNVLHLFHSDFLTHELSATSAYVFCVRRLPSTHLDFDQRFAALQPMHQAAAKFRVRARGWQVSQFGYSFLTAYGAQRAAETARREEQELWAARNRLTAMLQIFGATVPT